MRIHQSTEECCPSTLFPVYHVRDPGVVPYIIFMLLKTLWLLTPLQIDDPSAKNSFEYLQIIYTTRNLSHWRTVIEDIFIFAVLVCSEH